MKKISFVFPDLGFRQEGEVFDPQIFAYLCIEQASNSRDLFALARRDDFVFAIEYTANDWFDYGSDPLDGPFTSTGNLARCYERARTTDEVWERTLAVCQVAATCGFDLPPPASLTAKRL